MRSRTTATLRTTAAVGLAVVLAVTLPGASAQAAIDPATPPAIHQVARRAQFAGDTITLAVRYTCTNRPGPQGVVNYIMADVVRGASARYVVGLRGDTGGLLAADCTGHPQTRVLTLRRGSYALPGQPAPIGKAEVSVTISPRTTPDSGGWYVQTGPDVTLTGRVTVVRPRHHH